MSPEGITTLKKSLFSHTFFLDPGGFAVAKEWTQCKQKNVPVVFKGYSFQ